MAKLTIITPDCWEALRNATSARIALGRAGGSLPTSAWLDFKASHAAARDAVHCHFDAETLAAEIGKLANQFVIVDSAAQDRRTFLLRPDSGRRLDERSAYALQELQTSTVFDLAVVVSDGLSALAVHRQARPVLEVLLPKLTKEGWGIAPIVVARYGRVAIQDEIGQLLGAKLALILIGERPGLGSPDSLGAYIVHAPGPGKTDADRNCVSNIRQDGLSHAGAATTIHYLLTEARRRCLSGVQLKDQRSLKDAAGPTPTSLGEHGNTADERK